MPLLNEWIVKGNLNLRDKENLPDIIYRVEHYLIEKNKSAYVLDVKAIF